MATKYDARKLNFAQRSLLIEHIDDQRVPFIARCKSRRVLLRRKLIAAKPDISIRPKYTIVTPAGREAMAVILADCAEALVAAGFLEPRALPVSPIMALQRMKAGNRPEPGPVAPETDEHFAVLAVDI